MEQIEIGICLGLIYNNEGKLLIARRYQPDDPEFHDKWELPGGKVEWHENPEQAMVREAKEETGYDIEITRLLPKSYSYIREHGDKAIKMYFFCFLSRIVGGEQATSDREIAELKFIDPKEIVNFECLPIVQESVLFAEELK